MILIACPTGSAYNDLRLLLEDSVCLRVSKEWLRYDKGP